MQSATIEFEGGVVAELKDCDADFELTVSWPIRHGNMSQVVRLKAKKEDVRAFMDILLEAEEEEKEAVDVPH